MWVVNDINGDAFYCRFVQDKRVILVGPSRCSLENTADFVESHDLVVRVNYQHPVIPEHQPFIGKRIDVIYHNSCGLRDIKETFQPGFKFVWYERNRSMFDIRRFLRNTNTPGALIRPYRNRCSQLLGTDPNMGMLALMHLLDQPIQSLYLTGITFFFREPYHTGYPETRFGNSEIIKTRKTPSHDADIQFDFFKENLLNDARLTIDPTLQRICNDAIS